MQDYFSQCLQDLDIPKHWEDVSYCNDACPSFENNGLMVFIDHKNPSMREVDSWARFLIKKSEDYGYGKYITETNNWQVVKAILNMEDK